MSMSFMMLGCDIFDKIAISRKASAETSWGVSSSIPNKVATGSSSDINTLTAYF